MDDTTKRDIQPSSNAAQSADEMTGSRPATNPSAGHAAPGPAALTAPSQFTYASKLPADHPGLQLDVQKGRTLRRGPVVTGVAIVAGATAIALVVAFSPSKDGAKAASATPSAESSPPEIVLPDSIKNPTPAPRTPAMGAAQQDPTPASGAAGGRQHLREAGTRRSGAGADERNRILASPILVDVDNPVQTESGVHPPVLGVPAAGLLSADRAAAPPPSSASASVAGQGDANMQQHKSDFLTRDGLNSSTYVSQPVLAPRSPYEVKAGTIIPTSLITGINSDLPGQIVGQVRENVYDTVTGNYLLIPQGSRLLATYDSAVTFGQQRVLVCWNRLIRPDGISIGLECMPGVDLSGYAGFADDVDHHWFRIITGVALGTLLSATAQRSQGDVSGYNPTVPQLWAANAGSSVNQAGQAITQKNLSIQPTITVRPGYSVNVLVSKDIVLPPYNRADR
ncbi:MAG TPA: TrbI/VirB10 family protein [Acidothermaceae bacterium]